MKLPTIKILRNLQGDWTTSNTVFKEVEYRLES